MFSRTNTSGMKVEVSGSFFRLFGGGWMAKEGEGCCYRLLIRLACVHGTRDLVVGEQQWLVSSTE